MTTPALGIGTLDDETLPLNHYGGPEGEPYQELRGCHLGKFANLNIPNPQPGWHYKWELNRPGSLQHAAIEGYQPVRQGDPEARSAWTDPRVGQPVDGFVTFNDVILVKCPMDRYAANMAEAQTQADNQLRRSAEAFEAMADPVEEEFGRRSGAPTRYHRRDHGVTYDDNL